jgi:hemolysin III
VLFTGALCWQSRGDGPRLISLLIFGLSVVNLYGVSALYHIGSWRPSVHRRLRALDHGNIYLAIAGTYTPLSYNVLSGWLRPTVLAAVWLLAALGVGLAPLTLRASRGVITGVFVGMGWVSVATAPAFLAALPWPALALAVFGGAVYTTGGIIYARRRPDPFPAVLGFHEIFHICVVVGGAAFAAIVWIWALHFPRL